MRRPWFPPALALALAAIPAPDTARAQDDAPPPAGKLQVVTPRPDDIIATGINARGDVIGFQWQEEQPGVLAQVPFFARGEAMTFLPTLQGYTATFPYGISDDGVVAGRASKPAAPGVRVFLRNQAFVWDAEKGIRGLGVPEGDMASLATGISRDGRRVAGFTMGDERIRACVWDRDAGDGDTWTVTVLPHADRLGSQVVAISPDGKLVAAVDGASPCLWTRADSGAWTREAIGDPGSLIPRAVNDSATVVGLRHDGEGNTHAVVWTRASGVSTLEEPPGYVKAEANAVNNAGVVVGIVDGPGGSIIGPNAFVFRDGSFRLISEGGPDFTAATAINDANQVAGVVDREEPEEEPAAEPAKEADKPESR